MEALAVPEIGAGRTQIYIDAIKKAAKMIEDRPVFAGIIGAVLPGGTAFRCDGNHVLLL